MKVYPNGVVTVSEREEKLKGCATISDGNAAVLTVWKKSLLFNCNGFTVFDGKGDLVFRVDNYMDGNKGEILLMDASGHPLLTIRRKRLSLGDSWLVYEGETDRNPRFSVRKNVSILNTKCLAYVNYTGNKNGVESSNATSKMYEIEGSFGQRCCAVYDEKRRRVAEIKRKEAVGGAAFGIDVFRLIVQPELDTALAMALVILLDKMFGSSNKLALFF